jgi:hypothetical protein
LISEKDAVHDHERHPNNYAQRPSPPVIRRLPSSFNTTKSVRGESARGALKQNAGFYE